MFETDLLTDSLGLSLLVALIAGFLSFLSPSVLPIVPAYVAFMAGASLDPAERHDRRAAIFTAAFFVLGLSSVFLILGLVAASAGQVFQQYQRQMAVVSGIVIVVFGLHFLRLLHIPFLSRDLRFNSGRQGGTAVGAYILGLAFAFGWSPCLGPVLGAVLAMSAQETSLPRGTALLATYAIGLGTPFIIVAIFLNESTMYLMKLKPYMRTVEAVIGAMLVVIGIAMASGAFTAFAFWLLELFPALGAIG